MNFASNFALVRQREESCSEEDLEFNIKANVFDDESSEEEDAAGNEEKLEEQAPRQQPQQQQQQPQRQRPAASAGSGLLSRLSNLFSSDKPPKGAVPAAKPRPAKQQNQRIKEERARRKLQKQDKGRNAERIRRAVDTNVVSLNLATLEQDSDDVFAGDPIHCSECKAVLSKNSKLTKKGSDDEKAADKEIRFEEIVQKKAVFEDKPAPGSKQVNADKQAALAPPPIDKDKDKDKDKDMDKDMDMDIDKDKDKDKDVVVVMGPLIWKCEFCGHENDIDIEQEEIPTGESRDYVIAPAPEAAADMKVDASAGGVIFCIDTSGSMCVTQEVPGHIKLKGVREPSEADFGILQADDIRPQKNTKTTWVSRMQCVKAAVDQQLQEWSKAQPNRRVGLVTFSNDVTILGDGTSEPVTVAGDKLSNQDKLQEIGQQCSLDGYKSVSDTFKNLSDRIFALEESGRTALGPAVLISVVMASKTPGSRVVVCTDGLANVGLGSLDVKGEAREKVEQWYEGLGNLAKLSGVTVSVISIKGDECALEDLGNVTEISGGSVSRVDPLELTKNFSSILENPVIATQVTATLMLHKGLKFRNEDEETNRLTREIGNVTKETEISFEYTIKSLEAMENQFGKSDVLPFQVQIHYTKLDGMKCLRVISKEQRITDDSNVAEKDVRVEVLAANAAQQSAKMAEQGDYMGARAHNLLYGRVMKRAAATKEQRHVLHNWVNATEEYDDSLQVGVHRSKEVNLDRELLAASSSAASSGSSAVKLKKKAAKKYRGDADYTSIQSNKAKNSSSFL